jgi:hypothetical protein
MFIDVKKIIIRNGGLPYIGSIGSFTLDWQHIVQYGFNKEKGPHPLFLSLKFKWKSSHDVWFFKTLVGENTVCNMTKIMLMDLDVDNKQIRTKTWKGIGINSIEEAHVLVDYKMAIIGQRDVNF